MPGHSSLPPARGGRDPARAAVSGIAAGERQSRRGRDAAWCRICSYRGPPGKDSLPRGSFSLPPDTGEVMSLREAFVGRFGDGFRPVTSQL